MSAKEQPNLNPVAKETPRYNFTVVEATVPERLSKRYSLAPDGGVAKEPGGLMAEGSAKRHKLTLGDLGSRIDKAQGCSHLALMCSTAVLDATEVGIVTKGKLASFPTDDDKVVRIDGLPVVARTKEHFKHDEQPALLLLDYDPLEPEQALDPDAFIEVLHEAVPALKTAPMLIGHSTSSHIYHGSELVQHSGGLRVYIGVQSGADIERAGRVIFERLWLAGHGYIMVNKAGRRIERTLIDASVWSPDRLDFFVGGAECEPPLEQRRPPCRVINGELMPLNTVEQLKDLEPKDRERFKALVDKARQDKLRESEQRLAEWVADRLKNSDGSLTAAALNRAAKERVLPPEFTIKLSTGEEVTISKVLTEKHKYDGVECCDPYEPEYRGNAHVGVLKLMGPNPYLFSQAHGGYICRLEFGPRESVTLIPGTRSTQIDTCHRVMRESETMFMYADQLVRIGDGGRVTPMVVEQLMDWLDRNVCFSKVSIKGEVYDTDCPKQLATIALSTAKENQREITGIVDHAVVRNDGTLLSRPGYDAATRLYLSPALDFRPVDYDNLLTIEEAMAILWRPFSQFPFASDLDRSVLFSAILTALNRATLDIAYGYYIDAPTAGTGKTLLAGALSVLAGDPEGTPMTGVPKGDDKEYTNKISACLRAGDRVFFLDNLSGDIRSWALEKLLTQRKHKERILGYTETFSAYNRMFTVFTANNADIFGDLSRRLLRLRIDSQAENPNDRSFKFDPVFVCQQNRGLMAHAAVSLILRALEGRDIGERKTSFPDWQALIGDTVTWVAARYDKIGLTDPMLRLKETIAADPEKERLYTLLAALRDLYGDETFTAADVEHIANDPFTRDEKRRELAEAVADILPANRKGQGYSARQIGTIFKHRRDRRVKGLMVIGYDISTKSRGKPWRVVETE